MSDAIYNISSPRVFFFIIFLVGPSYLFIITLLFLLVSFFLGAFIIGVWRNFVAALNEFTSEEPQMFIHRLPFEVLGE